MGHALTQNFNTCLLLQEYQLADGEAHSILPCLIEKSGHNQVGLRFCKQCGSLPASVFHILMVLRLAILWLVMLFAV